MEKVKYSDEFICPKCGRHTALVFHAGGGHQAHCLFCDLYYDIEIAKPTNADRIRNMSDEEFSHFLFGIQCAPASRPKEWLDWLKREAEE